MDCKSIHKIVFDYVEGSLSQAETDAITAHLDACPPCREFVDEYSETSCMCRDALGCDWGSHRVSLLKARLRNMIGGPGCPDEN